MPTPRLDVRDSLGQRVVTLDTSLFSIGRRSTSDLHLLDTEVSRDHAEIMVTDGVYLLRDRGSRYGTFVNGTPITEQTLRHGDRITFGRGGRTELIFFATDDTASQQSASWSAGDLRQIASLLEALRGLGGGRVLDEVLALVLDSAIEITGAERGFIMLASAAGVLELKLARAAGRMTLPAAGFATSRKIPEDVFLTGREAIVADLRDGDLPDAHLGTIALGIRHVLCTPLRLVRYVERADADTATRNIGVLYLDSRVKGQLLSHGTRAALETLASEAALAIENARLYRETLEKARIDQELRTAAQIQQALLPPPRKTRDFFDAMGSSVPCRAVGGDFFEYMDLPDGGFGFALGDVAGKGPPAALLTAVLQGILAGQAQASLTPSETMRRINVALISRGVESRFATAFLGHLSPDGTLTYCNAGHNPPFVFGASGVRRLETGGMIIGLFPAAVYDQETIRLESGDTVVVFSDGVSEAASETGEEFADARIEATIQGTLGQPCDRVLQALLDAVRDFTRGTTQGDDITAMVIQYT